MANEKQLRILKQGLEVWGLWRIKHPLICPDLIGADLIGADLGAVDLSNANLRGAKLRGAKLRGANLGNADLIRADLGNARLGNANLIGARLNRAELGDADLSSADLSRADIRNANLFRANLYSANLSNADLSNANLSSARLNRALLCGAHLSKAYLSNASLGDADLTGADLSRADFSNADFGNANLSGVNFSETNFLRANLSGVDLSGASLHYARMYRAVFVNSDLREVKGLKTVEHLGPSEISISTIYRSEGKIPEIFLRGCGVPEVFIAQIPALVAAIQPIQFYSCFISYSSKDEEFARRLHKRMRAAGLRVWFAPEDIKGGDKLYEQIDRAIQIHDRLLLVLSESSLQSEWVMTEIRRARKAEVNENRRKLFPIRLTDYETLKEWQCFDADVGKDLAVEVREYYIPDFSNWKIPNNFEKGFARMLSDLKAST
jgi:uncharacterized protein YjbI with pentapeptide repeats